MVTTTSEGRVQLLTRVPKSLKTRVDRHKKATGKKRGYRATLDEIVVNALEDYLKKFDA